MSLIYSQALTLKNLECEEFLPTIKSKSQF